MLERIKRWAAELKAQVVTLWFCSRDARTPLAAKILAALVVAYALSPIDLIPDFIPVLGYLDDLVLVPAGVFLAIRLIPAEVLADARGKADARLEGRPTGYWAALVIVLVWLGLGYWAWSAFVRSPA